MLRNYGRNLTAKCCFVEVPGGITDLNSDACRFAAFAFTDGEQQFEQFLLHPRRGAAHHAEVQQRNKPSFGQKNITGMRIGMKHAIDQHLLQIGLEEFLGQHSAIYI